jgi:ubiquinone/menaquinone biosynthesis C-methylase UbiE
MGARDYVEETRFGFWFLGTETWRVHVIDRALRDLVRMMRPPLAQRGVVLDVGCGQGLSLGLLHERFRPARLIGLDADPKALAMAARHAQGLGIAAEVREGDAQALPFESGSVDLVFCHQTLHHLVHQDDAVREFHRVLAPGGWLLLAESTRAYIDSWIIRTLFRHPMEQQRSAPEYLDMLRRHGLEFAPEQVSLPYLWWSRADLGALEWFGFRVPERREETLVNVVARKPAG